MTTQQPASIAPTRLDPSSELPLYRQLYRALREDILDGRIRPGERLAASRELADQLGVSRNTVLGAFRQLKLEGYVTARTGAGTFVSEEIPDDLLGTRGPVARSSTGSRSPSHISDLEKHPTAGRGWYEEPRPFQPGVPALDKFPRRQWHQAVREGLSDASETDLGYGHSAGQRVLREGIARHLWQARGLDCTADDIVVVSGARQAVDLAVRIVTDQEGKAWVEDPGYPGTRATIHAAGIKAVPVPVDQNGLSVEEGLRLAPDASLAVVTPSHQYPLGPALSLQRRLALLDWASQARAWIIEDDYDSLYRYSGRPLSSLKSLDRSGRVIYVGTFSKTLFPALRMGYVVLPPALVERFLEGRYHTDRQPPLLEQSALSVFLQSGAFHRHVRRMRLLYQKRQEALLQAVDELLGRSVRVERTETGIHLVGWLQETLDDGHVAKLGLTENLHLAPLSAYSLNRDLPPGLLLGFAAFSTGTMHTGIRSLARVLDRAKS